MITMSNVFTPETAWHAGVSLGNDVTVHFTEHIRALHADANRKVYTALEQEKCFHPWILFKKKKYCGIKFDEDKSGAVVSRGASFSGTANKRRDSCLFVHNIYNAMVDPLLYERDRSKSVAVFHTYMRDLLAGRVPFDDMVITKSIQSSYKNDNLAQCKVVAKQRAREPGSETKSGGRLKMVYVQGPRGASVGDLAEDAEYARANGLKFDLKTYIENQIKTPVMSLLSLLVDAPERLIKTYVGDADRVRSGVPRISDFLGKRPRPPDADAGGEEASPSQASSSPPPPPPPPPAPPRVTGGGATTSSIAKFVRPAAGSVKTEDKNNKTRTVAARGKSTAKNGSLARFVKPTT